MYGSRAALYPAACLLLNKVELLVARARCAPRARMLAECRGPRRSLVARSACLQGVRVEALAAGGGVRHWRGAFRSRMKMNLTTDSLMDSMKKSRKNSATGSAKMCSMLASPPPDRRSSCRSTRCRGAGNNSPEKSLLDEELDEELDDELGEDLLDVRDSVDLLCRRRATPCPGPRRAAGRTRAGKKTRRRRTARTPAAIRGRSS